MSEVFSNVGAVVVAAGSSQRMGVDKAFLSLAGKPLLAWSVDVCQSCDLLDKIVIVLSEVNLASGRELMVERGWSKVVGVCLGGERRQDSVARGLEKLEDCDWVVVHDGARPFLTQDLIRRGLVAASETGAAAAAVPVKNTIKLAGDDGLVRQTLHRRHLWAAQTPQVFRFAIIRRACRQIEDEATDDASMVESLGYKVRLYMGDYNNIKITTPGDLALAEVIAHDGESNASWNRL